MAHVVKNVQMKMIRNEFMRAHTLISRCVCPASADDALPASVRPEDLLDLILQEVDEVTMTYAFVRLLHGSRAYLTRYLLFTNEQGNQEHELRNEERRSRANTLTEQSADEKR